MTTAYILKRDWQSGHGIKETLYLGYNDQKRIDCLPDKNNALHMTKEECEEWLLILSNSQLWNIEEVVLENNETQQTEDVK